MPKRTNEFQRLVAMIHRALGDQKATITESALVPVAGLPYEREVDVLIETDAAPYRVKIAVEAKDHSRKLDVGEIDEIIAKYRGPGSIPVNKVVVVSRNGFTQHAADKASLAAIELLTLEEIDRAQWSEILLPPRSPVQGFQIGPYPKDVNITPCPVGHDANDFLMRSVIVCNCPRCNGRHVGSPFGYAVHHCNTHLAGTPAFNQCLGFIKGRGGGSFEASVTIARPHWVLTYSGKSQAVERFGYVAHTRWGMGEFRVKAYSMSGQAVEPKVVQHGTFTAAGYKIDLVLGDGMDFSKSTLHVSEAPEKPD